MKILTQKRDEIIELPKKIWATTSGTKGVVVTSRATLDSEIGKYKDIKRAKEVLAEILQKYTARESVYIMPEE